MTDVDRVREVLKSLLNAGTWFISALEIDEYDQPYSGEQLERMIKQALPLLDGKVLVEKAQYLMMRQQMRYLGMVLSQNGEATITEKTQREFSDKAIKLENIMTESGGMSIRLTYLTAAEEELPEPDVDDTPRVYCPRCGRELDLCESECDCDFTAAEEVEG